MLWLWLLLWLLLWLPWCQVVANITGRAETLSAAFLLSSLLFYTRSFRAPSFAPGCAALVASVVAVVAAVLCKETALVAPALFGVTEVALRLRREPRGSSCGRGVDAAVGTGAVSPSEGQGQVDEQVDEGVDEQVGSVTSPLHTLLRTCWEALLCPRLCVMLTLGMAGLWTRVVVLSDG